jgi:hypothetical protein
LRFLDELRAAIRADDWVEAPHLHPVERRSVEKTYAPAGLPRSSHCSTWRCWPGGGTLTRYPRLARMAKAAFAAGDLARAERYANEALAAARNGVFWWTGDALQQGNIVLQRPALRRSDAESARRRLQSAGTTPGSSTLDSMGPNKQLAKDLLDRGGKGCVLEYLEECGIFWTGNRGKLAGMDRAGQRRDSNRTSDETSTTDATIRILCRCSPTSA